MDGAMGLIAFFGGLLLAAVILYAAFRNRSITARQKAQTEAATHRLYEEEDREAHLQEDQAQPAR